MDKNLTQKIDQLSNDYFQNEFKVIERVYIDLACIYDFKIAALIQMLRTEAEYSYVIAKLPIYEGHYNRSIETCFPVLNISDKQIAEFIANPKNHELLSLAAPITNLYDQIPDLIKLFNNHNRKMDKSRDLQFFFNCRDFVYDPKMQQSLTKAIQGIDPHVIVRFMNEKYNVIATDFILNMDAFIIEDVQSFIDVPQLAKLMFSEGCLQNKIVVALLQIPPEHLTDKTIPIAAKIIETEATMSLFTGTHFSYSEYGVIVAPTKQQ